MSKIKTYFEAIAPLRRKQRKSKSYYWDDITRYCDFFIHEDYSVLEIGCGTGELIAGIKGKRKTGIDFSEKMIAEAKKQFPYLDLKVMAAENLQLEEKYDVIILSNLIGYLEDIQLVFEQLHKVCHEHTKIIVTYYNLLWEPLLKLGEWVGYKTKTPKQNSLSLSEINNLLYLSDFYTYRNSRRMLLPVYIPLFSEFLNNFVSKLPLLNNLCINNFSFSKPDYKLKNSENIYSVSVIIPARNESGNIENALKLLPEIGNKTEIIFVESNSTDDSWNKINDVKEKYFGIKEIKSFQISEPGKNAAVKKGFDEATGDILMILDADLTVYPGDLQKFYHAIANGKGDFINGSRLVYPVEKEAMRFLNLLGNKFFSLIFSWLLDQRIKDTLCGTKVLFKKDYDRLKRNRNYFGNFDPFGDFDLLFGAYKLNLCITELPVRYRERTYGRTNISRLKHGLLLLRMCFFAARKIKFR